MMIPDLTARRTIIAMLCVFAIIGAFSACLVVVPPADLTERERQALLEFLESSGDIMPRIPYGADIAYFGVAGSAVKRDSPVDCYFNLGCLPADLRKVLAARHPHFSSPRLVWRFSKRPVCFLAFMKWKDEDQVFVTNGWVKSTSGSVDPLFCIRDHGKWKCEPGNGGVGSQRHRRWYEGPFPR